MPTREEIDRRIETERAQRPGNADNSDLDHLSRLLDCIEVTDDHDPNDVINQLERLDNGQVGGQEDQSDTIDLGIDIHNVPELTQNEDGSMSLRGTDSVRVDGFTDLRTAGAFTDTSNLITGTVTNDTSSTVNIRTGNQELTVSGNSITVSETYISDMDMLPAGITGGSLSTSISSTYPGLHPDLHEAYATLIDSLRYRQVDDITVEAIRGIRDALSTHLEAVNSSIQMRENMLGYIEYLTERLRNLDNVGLSQPLTEEELQAGLEADRIRKAKNKLTCEKDNKADKRSGLITPIGFEYTYHAPPIRTFRKLTGKKNPCIEDGISLLKLRLKNELKENRSRIYNDGGIIEVCSPVHKTKTSIYKWFDKVDEVAKNYKMMPNSKQKGGGGLHINISYNKDLEKWRETYINFFIMMANYPEINWILNEPSDNRTANSLQKEFKFKEAMRCLKTDDIETSWKRFSNIGSKSYGVNCKDNYHFEVRTFDMVRNKSELKDMIDFIDALLRLCHDAALEDLTLPLLEHPVSLFEDKVIYHEKEETAVKDFNRLLRALNLSPHRYRKYIKRNFYVRRNHYGKQYLA